MKRTYFKLLRADTDTHKLISWSSMQYGGAREQVYTPELRTTPTPGDGPLAVFTTLADAFAAHAKYSRLDLDFPALIARCTIVPSKETEVWVESHGNRWYYRDFPVGTQLADEVTIHSAVPPWGRIFNADRSNPTPVGQFHGDLSDRYRDYYRACYHMLREWPELAALFPPVKSAAKKTKEVK